MGRGVQALDFGLFIDAQAHDKIEHFQNHKSNYQSVNDGYSGCSQLCGEHRLGSENSNQNRPKKSTDSMHAEDI